MASGRINRNVFPELVTSSGRVGGNTPKGCVSIVVYRRSVTPDRPSVTELPGLTSDSIYTADRRGGILISFGPNRSPRRVINPPELVGPRARTVLNCPDRTAYLPPTADRPRRAELSVESAEADPTSVLGCECPVIFKGIGPGTTPERDSASPLVLESKCPVTLKGVGARRPGGPSRRGSSAPRCLHFVRGECWY